MKKKKNAFTLIELLAIIVILAIIAVITVPIILNIIENSRKGTSIDSAYGYRDSVQQYYISKSVVDSTQQAPSGVFNVSDLPEDFSVSGTAPSDGWVNLDKGQVLSYSLKFGDYTVTYDESTPTPVATKNGGLAIATCPGCVFAWYGPDKMKWIKGSSGENEASQNNKLTNGYTDDYTTLDKNYFLGHVLNNDGYIVKSYACGIEDSKTYCIEGYNQGANERNIEILRSIFSRCSDEDLEHNACNSVNSLLRNGAGNNGALVGIRVNSSSCTVSNSGNSWCTS